MAPAVERIARAMTSISIRIAKGRDEYLYPIDLVSPF
jgi:hypothetical protein